jgi:hypothetical protein
MGSCYERRRHHYHQEEDTSPILNNELHTEYQSIRIRGYSKKKPSRSLRIESKSFSLSREASDKSLIDFAEQCAYAKEESDPRFSRPMGEELDISIFFNSVHAHDRVAGRSISRVIIMVGSTPVIQRSNDKVQFKRQLDAPSYRLGNSMRYMLRSLGIKVSHPSHLSGDNAGIISNTTNPDATSKKKHIALIFQKRKNGKFICIETG